MNLTTYLLNSFYDRFSLRKSTGFTIVHLLSTLSLYARQDLDPVAIRRVMKQQKEAWNKADIEQFMQGCWKSDSLKFIGASGISHGWQTTLDNYRRNYASAEAMGVLTFTILPLKNFRHLGLDDRKVASEKS